MMADIDTDKGAVMKTGQAGGQVAVDPTLGGLDVSALAAWRRAHDPRVPRLDREAEYVRAAVITHCVFVLTGVDLTEALAAEVAPR
jgi:hypothetical protein